jgi:predicted flap endonuclease-1-like 5' DNA nuclease
MLAQRDDETVLEYWISFWPTAPFFGVRWRFEGLAPGFEAFRPAEAELDAKPAADPAPETAPEAAKPCAAEPVAEAVPDAVETAAPVAGPEAEAPEVEAPAAVSEPDDLKRIKGVGPKLETMLNDLGIFRFAQIAALSEAELAQIDDRLGTFKGRPFRDDWIAQAAALS